MRLVVVRVVEGIVGYFLGLMGKLSQILEEMDKEEIASGKGHLLT